MGRRPKTTQNEANIDKSKPNELFEIINMMFTNPSKIKDVPKSILLKYSFLINRRLSIAFPQQVNMLQIKNINQIETLYFWSEFLKQYNKIIPRWVYIRGVKTKDENSFEDSKSGQKSIPESLIKSYCCHYGFSPYTIKLALKFFNKEMSAELEYYDKMINDNSDNDLNKTN